MILAACFHTERSWHTYRFPVAFVSGRQDLPSEDSVSIRPSQGARGEEIPFFPRKRRMLRLSEERAFSLTSSERRAFYCG